MAGQERVISSRFAKDPTTGKWGSIINRPDWIDSTRPGLRLEPVLSIPPSLLVEAPDIENPPGMTINTGILDRIYGKERGKGSMGSKLLTGLAMHLVGSIVLYLLLSRQESDHKS